MEVKSPPRPPKRLLVIQVLVLAALGGFSDAVSIKLFGLFTGHITGATVLAAVHLVAHENFQFLFQAAAITLFLFGTSAGVLMCRTLQTALYVESLFFLLSYLMVFTDRSPLAAIALTSMAMGIQNGALQKAGNTSVHTTFLTGMSTRWVTDQIYPSQNQTVERALLVAVMVFFFIGAVLGGLCALWIQSRAFVIMSVVVGIVALASGFRWK